MNAIVSKGRRVWEEGGEKFFRVGLFRAFGGIAEIFLEALKVWRYTLETFRGIKSPGCSFFGVPKGFKSMAGAIFL